MRGQNAEGAEVTQKSQKNTKNGFGVGVKPRALSRLVSIAAPCLPLKAPPFQFPSRGGVRRRRGVVVAMVQTQSVPVGRTTPSGFACHPSNGGELFRYFFATSASLLRPLRLLPYFSAPRSVLPRIQHGARPQCTGQVFSDTFIGNLIAACCSKALGGKLPNFECSRTLL